MDGVSNNEGFFKSYGIQPAIDSIQEFKVQTNITSSEFGEAAGANVAVATKSGTNQLHGSAYEFLRNSALDAPEWISKITQPVHPRRLSAGTNMASRSVDLSISPISLTGETRLSGSSTMKA